MRRIALSLVALPLMFLSIGCAQPPTSENEVFDDIVQLTSGFKAAGEASFSPDMNWVLFKATPATESNYQMFIARLLRRGDQVTGIGQPIRVTPPDSRNTSGFFSPDGLSVIFASTTGKEPKNPSPESTDRWPFPKGMEIFRADAWQGAIAATEFSRGINLAQHPLTDNTAYDAECAYSPDGKWIVFTSTRDGDPTKPERTARDADLYVMKADGTQVTRLTRNDGYDGSALFSSDQSRIVFRADRANRNQMQVYVADLVYDPQGNITGLSREKQLTDDAAIPYGPSWYPGGSHLVYAGAINAAQEYELVLMRNDGSRPLRLTFTPGTDTLPVFSPDGKYLLWSSTRSHDKTPQIYIARFKFPKAG